MTRSMCFACISPRGRERSKPCAARATRRASLSERTSGMARDWTGAAVTLLQFPSVCVDHSQTRVGLQAGGPLRSKLDTRRTSYDNQHVTAQRGYNKVAEHEC